MLTFTGANNIVLCLLWNYQYSYWTETF